MSASLAAEFAAEDRAEGEEYVRRNTDSMFGWTWRSSRISAKLLCPCSTAGPKEEASLALHPAAGAAAAAAPPPAAPACCARKQPREPDVPNCPAAPPGVCTAAAHACYCMTACNCAAHAMLPATGAFTEGVGPGDGCSRAARARAQECPRNLWGGAQLFPRHTTCPRAAQQVVCLGKSCAPPQRFCVCLSPRATAEASRLSPWIAALWFVLTLWAKKKQKRLTKK